jgi:hypothetical protein
MPTPRPLQAADRIRAELPRVCPSPRLCPQWKTSNRILALVYIIYQRGGLWLPNQPRPGTAVHRPRHGSAAARHRRSVGVTERAAYGIVTDLTAADCIVNKKDRRNRYPIPRTSPCRNPSAGHPSAKSWPSWRTSASGPRPSAKDGYGLPTLPLPAGPTGPAAKTITSHHGTVVRPALPPDRPDGADRAGWCPLPCGSSYSRPKATANTAHRTMAVPYPATSGRSDTARSPYRQTRLGSWLPPASEWRRTAGTIGGP